MTGMVLITIATGLLLVFVAGVKPKRTHLSLYELERRISGKDNQAREILRRESLLDDVESLLRIFAALLLVVFVLLAVATFGWLLGALVATVVALEFGAIARIGLWRRLAQKVYERYEAYLLRFVEKFSGVFKLLRTLPPEQLDKRLDSRQELEHLVAESGTILTPDEKKLIAHSLAFDTRLVSEIMTPRSVIDSIGAKEHLGPLTLDELHKTGHSRFPVTLSDIDHVIGTLYVQDLLMIDAKRKSTSVEKAMERRVFYIREDQTLHHALAAFLKTKHHLFIVVNEFRETVGVLSLEDVIEALLGRAIVDEFDTHEDLRAVAARNPRGNNHDSHAVDV